VNRVEQPELLHLKRQGGTCQPFADFFLSPIQQCFFLAGCSNDCVNQTPVIKLFVEVVVTCQLLAFFLEPLNFGNDLVQGRFTKGSQGSGASSVK
jgi:hypothetical protein